MKLISLNMWGGKVRQPLLDFIKQESKVKEYQISTTRSPLYRNFAEMKFADYTLVSPGIEVKTFLVPQVEVSDHLPMILEFE